jgi:hypothetical protein
MTFLLFLTIVVFMAALRYDPRPYETGRRHDW